MRGNKKSVATSEAKTEQNAVKPKQVKKMQFSRHFVFLQAAQPPCAFSPRKGERKMPDTPVIFNVAYTPYKLKRGSTETEIKAHAEKRAYYDFTGDTNYLRYMTTEGKLMGNESKKFTMLDYL